MTKRTLREHKLLQRGTLFHANCSKNVSSGGTLVMQVHNPSDSNVKIVLTDVKVTTTGPATVSTPHGASTDATGTELAVDNVAIGDMKTAEAVTYQDSTFSGASHTHEEYIGDGTGGLFRPPHGGTDSQVGSVVFPGEDFFLEITNDDGSNSHNCSITVEFYEVPT